MRLEWAGLWNQSEAVAACESVKLIWVCKLTEHDLVWERESYWNYDYKWPDITRWLYVNDLGCYLI